MIFTATQTIEGRPIPDYKDAVVGEDRLCETSRPSMLTVRIFDTAVVI